MRAEIEPYKNRAVESICRDLKAMIEKRRRKLDSIESGKNLFGTFINGDEYRTENEIMDAYGCGMITDAQRREAIRRLNFWADDDAANALRYEIKALSAIRANLLACMEDGCL